MTAQIDWIRKSPTDKKEYRRMVVGWQNSEAVLHTLIKSFNREYLKSKSEQKEHHGMKEIALKKLIISSMVELKVKVDSWVAKLNQDGEDTTVLNKARKANRPLLEKAEQLRDIRNIAFHFGDVMLGGNELVQLYEEIANWSLEELNNILVAICKIGNHAKDICVKKA